MAKKDLHSRLSKLSKRYNRQVWLAFALRFVNLLFVVQLFIWSLGAVITGRWHWAFLFVPLAAILLGILLFLLTVICELKMRDYAHRFLAMINGRCGRPYTFQDLVDLKIVGRWFRSPISFQLWADYLIAASKPVRDNRPDQAKKEAEQAWVAKVEELFKEALEELPHTITAYRLKVRIKRAIGNQSMHWRDRQILLLTVYSYFWPDAEDIDRVKRELGGWFSHVPPQPKRKDFGTELLSATQTHTYEPKVKPETNKQPEAKAKTQTEPKTLAPDKSIDLKELRHELLPLAEVDVLVPESIDSRLVWAVLIVLLEPGKTISIAGAWLRKEDLIHKAVARIFTQEGWKYPGNKACSAAIDWMHKIEVLNKRSHARDYSLDFHVSGKGESASEICRLLNRAKSNTVTS